MFNSVPPKELDEIKDLVEDYTGHSIYNWYTSDNGTEFHLSLGRWGERLHITYKDKIHYRVEVGKVYESGLIWKDIKDKVINHNNRNVKYSSQHNGDEHNSIHPNGDDGYYELRDEVVSPKTLSLFF
jgi:hypothetical protein